VQHNVRAAVSCGSDPEQLVLYIVQLHQPGMHRAAFEVDRYRLKSIGAKFFPCLRFGEDAMAKRARAVANFEDQLHALRILQTASAACFRANISMRTRDTARAVLGGAAPSFRTRRPWSTARI